MEKGYTGILADGVPDAIYRRFKTKNPKQPTRDYRNDNDYNLSPFSFYFLLPATSFMRVRGFVFVHVLLAFHVARLNTQSRLCRWSTGKFMIFCVDRCF